MAVANCLDFDHDDYVLDMCAAPGGKTCFTASKLSSAGLMIANDINKLRAGILSENVERFGLQNTIVTNSDPVKLEKYFNNFLIRSSLMLLAQAKECFVNLIKQ